MLATELLLEHHTSEQALKMSDAIADLACENYAPTANGNPFYSKERFLERFANQTSQSGFDLVTATIDGVFVGFIFGCALPSQTRWWKSLTTELPENDIAEDGTRTVALMELHVQSGYRRQGIARQLHDEFLRPRREQRATVYARPDNTAAYNAYQNWGWRKIGQAKPRPDSPTYDVLILPLRHESLAAENEGCTPNEI